AMLTTRRALISVALLVGAFVALPTTTASAGLGPVDYAGCVITVEPSQFEAGADVDVSGDGLQPNISTPILFDDQQIGTANTDADGHFGPTTVTTPADAEDGLHSISVSCDTTGLNVSSSDVVVGSGDIAKVTLSDDSVGCGDSFDATLSGAEPGSEVRFE